MITSLGKRVGPFYNVDYRLQRQAVVKVLDRLS